MGFGRFALSAAGKVGIVLAVVAAFIFGMVATVYLSLRTSEVTVPDILGKDRLTAESMLDEAGLKLRVRGQRPSAERPDTVLSQLPEAGQVVKVGIPVAVEISRAPKEGESVPVREEPKQETEKPAENSNANQSTTATNQNQNQNQNRSQRNRNRNANNANNANGRNANNSNNANGANANRNANANAPRTTNNRNANTAPNANRTPNNQNANRRAPAATPPPPARPVATGTP
ncbi:MAG TPA: PASTA domain-containing protein [Pyrinomonadaceae bacterium]|nr:PASTA domain-containing protein [Pyrinomonadaceae bacterium]